MKPQEMSTKESKAPIGIGFWDRREGQASWWDRRDGETEQQQKARWNYAIFMAFDPDDPDLILD